MKEKKNCVSMRGARHVSVLLLCLLSACSVQTTEESYVVHQGAAPPATVQSVLEQGMEKADAEKEPAALEEKGDESVAEVVLPDDSAMQSTEGSNEQTQQPTLSQNKPEADSTMTVEPPTTYDHIDVDLTQMSSLMVYAEVLNILYSAPDYFGKTIKMQGECNIFVDPAIGVEYYSVIIEDATACCAQGIEFHLQEGMEYPEVGEQVTVVGVYEMYEADGFRFCRLGNAALIA